MQFKLNDTEAGIQCNLNLFLRIGSLFPYFIDVMFSQFLYTNESDTQRSLWDLWFIIHWHNRCLVRRYRQKRLIFHSQTSAPVA